MAQQKKTKPPELDDMEDITAGMTDQQIKFCIGVAFEGKSATDAWIAAYDASNMSRNSIYVEASRALNHPKISLWIAAARKAEMGASLRSKEQHIRRLDKLQQIAIDTGNVGAAVNAEVSIGKAMGHYVERHEDVTPDPLRALREIEQYDPDLARRLAERDGINLNETQH